MRIPLSVILLVVLLQGQGWSGVLGRQITPLKPLLTVGIRKSISLNRSSWVSLRIKATKPDHQSFPEKLYLGQMSGTGWRRIFAAETVFVCHACNSTVSVAQWISLGCTCWRSLKRALQPSWKRARPKM